MFFRTCSSEAKPAGAPLIQRPTTITVYPPCVLACLSAARVFEHSGAVCIRRMLKACWVTPILPCAWGHHASSKRIRGEFRAHSLMHAAKTSTPQPSVAASCGPDLPRWGVLGFFPWHVQFFPCSTSASSSRLWRHPTKTLVDVSCRYAERNLRALAAGRWLPAEVLGLVDVKGVKVAIFIAHHPNRCRTPNRGRALLYEVATHV